MNRNAPPNIARILLMRLDGADHSGNREVMERRVVHYSGRVQGVGFRAMVRQLARGIAVSGYVRNLHDGRVELVVEGDSFEINRLLTEVRRVMSDNIDDVEQKSLAATGEFNAFQIG